MFKKKSDYNVIELILLVLIGAMVIFTCLGVFTRYVLNKSMDWTEELSRFIYIWITFLGAFVVMTKNKHVAIDNFINFLPDKISNKINKINKILMIGFLVFLTIGGLKVSQAAMVQVAPGTGIRIGYIYIVIPISSLLMIVYLIKNFQSRK